MVLNPSRTDIVGYNLVSYRHILFLIASYLTVARTIPGLQRTNQFI